MANAKVDGMTIRFDIDREIAEAGKQPRVCDRRKIRFRYTADGDSDCSGCNFSRTGH